MLPYHDQAEGLRRIMGVHSSQHTGRVIGLLHIETPVINVADWITCLRSHDTHALHVQAPLHGLTSPHNAEQQATRITPHAYGHDQTWFNMAAHHPQRWMENERFTSAFSDNALTPALATVEAWTHAYDLVLLDSLATLQPSQPTGAMLGLLWRYPLLLVMPGTTAGLQDAYALIKQACQRWGSRSLAIVVSGQPAARAKNWFKQLQQVAQRFLQVPLQLAGTLEHAKDTRGLQQLARNVQFMVLASADAALATAHPLPNQPADLMTA